jgi:hypothetical protein
LSAWWAGVTSMNDRVVAPTRRVRRLMVTSALDDMTTSVVETTTAASK